jgi:hypothetical protein
LTPSGNSFGASTSSLLSRTETEYPRYTASLAILYPTWPPPTIIRCSVGISTLVQDERFLLPIVKYIHKYPVEAGLCSSIEEYKWSSHVFYRVNMENVVNIEDILNTFSANRIEAIKRYTEYMETEEENWKAIKYRLENISIIGTDEFIMEIQGKKHKQSLDELLKRCCPTEEEFKLIKNGSRERYLTDYKVEYISMAKREGYTYKEIGENIGITGAAARSLIVENK